MSLANFLLPRDFDSKKYPFFLVFVGWALGDRRDDEDEAEEDKEVDVAVDADLADDEE